MQAPCEPVQPAPAVGLPLIGTLASSAAGRLFYQAALGATGADNGFVPMFFLIIPALSALASWPLSAWIRDVGFLPNALFFVGLALVSAPLLLFVMSFDGGERAGEPMPRDARPSNAG